MTPVFHGVEGATLPFGKVRMMRLSGSYMHFRCSFTTKVKRDNDTFTQGIQGLRPAACRILRRMTRLRAWTGRHGLTALFGVTAFAYCLNAFRESDAFYHLAAGRLIWQTRAIPHADPFSYLAEGATWIPHEWLAELLAYGTFNLVDYWGIMLAVALLGLASFGIAAHLARCKGAPLPVALAGTLVLGIPGFPAWIARPQVLAVFLAALLLLILEVYRRRPRGWHLIAVPALLLVWANLHGSFPLGILMAGWYAAAALLARRFAFGAETLPYRDAWRLLAAALAGALACLINPVGYHAFLYLWYVRPAAEAFNITEWKSILAFSGMDERAGALLIALAGLCSAWWYGLRRESRDLVALGMGAGLATMPFISIRHASFFAVIGAPFAVAAAGSWLAPHVARIGRRQQAWIVLAVCAMLLLGRVPEIPTSYYQRYRVPVSAADFAERAGVGRMFNLYNEGGYLIWRRYPGQQVSMDGRNEVYSGAPMYEFMRIVSDAPDWHALVRKHRIEAFFLAYNPPQLHRTISPLLARLKAEGWVPVYWDDLVVIYVPDDAAHADLVARYGMRHVDPFGDPAAIPREHAQAAAAELQRAVEQSRYHDIPLEYARRFLLSRP